MSTDSSSGEPSGKGSSRTDEQLVISAVYNALSLVTIYDDGMVSEPDRQGFSVQILPAGPGKYRALVWDAEPWKSGRPRYGDPRSYDVSVSVEPVEKRPYPPDVPDTIGTEVER